jgi:nucleoside-diphosphate-sugar epimerase
MKKNILVTGGAGYVGAPLVGLLLTNDYNVIVVDNLSFGGKPLLGVWHHPSFKFIKGDITSSDFLKSDLSDYQVDTVIHLAAIVGDPACANQPDLARRTNMEASLNLLEISMKNQVKRFIFASTCSNYGKMSDSDKYINETSPLSPVSLYAELKVKFEKIILNELNRTNGFCPTSLRFATVYGISPRMRFDLTVNEFTKELALGRELEVFGEQFWRPYCHVYDFARAMILLLSCDKEKIAYNVFNVGDTSENYQKQMIVDEIIKFIPDANVKYVYKDEDPRDYRVSFKKIQDELGFKISKTVPEGIREIKYLLDNKVLINPDSSTYRNS